MNEIEPVSAYIFHGSKKRNVDTYEPLTYHKLSRAFPDNVHSFTVGSLERIQSIVERQARLGEIGVLILDAHGTPGRMALGSSEVLGHLNTKNVNLYKAIFDRVHSTKGVVILRACCKGDENHLAKKIHDLYGIRVCATEKSISQTGRIFLIRNLEGEFEDHSFDRWGNDVSVVYENGKKKIFKNQSKQILELARLQGYEHGFFNNGFPKLLPEFQQYLIEYSEEAFIMAGAALYCRQRGDCENEFKLYRRAVERACDGNEADEIIHIFEMLRAPFFCFTKIQKERAQILTELRQRLVRKLAELPNLKAAQYLITRNGFTVDIYESKYRELKQILPKDCFLNKLNELLESIDSKPEQEIQETINRCEKEHAELDQLNPKTIEIMELQEALESRKKKLQAALDLKSQSGVLHNPLQASQSKVA